jgi:hypothetical protein
VKNLFSFLCLISCSCVLFGQEKMDSVAGKADSVRSKFTEKVDQVNIDSLQPRLSDSLRHSYQRLDSVRSTFNSEADSLKNSYDKSISKLDIYTAKLIHSKDSLQKLNLPTDKHTHKIDSVSQLRQKTTSDFNAKASSLKAKTTDKLKGLDLPPQYNEPLQQITGKVDGFNVQSDFVKIPEADVPGYSLQRMEGVGDIASKAGDLGEIGDIGNLPKVETPVGDLGAAGEQAKELQGDLKNVSKGNLEDVKSIEKQAGKIDGVGELQKGTTAIDDYKSKVGDLSDPNKAKEQAVEMAKEKAIDHFAGKQEQLKAAMDKMAKYKQKYSSVSSIKDLPKRAPNAMKGKPLVERLVPGIFFQFQQKNYNLFDFNPYLGYKLSGRLTTGLGWNQRYAYDRRSDNWNSRARIFGPRVYVDFKLGKGFTGHLETEIMNTFVPFSIHTQPEAGRRDWVWGMMLGMKKEYKIYKNLRGTVLIQYNLFNPKYKAPYADRLNSRIGFEYALKKKVKKKSE